MEKGRVGSEIWENPSLEHSRGSLEFQQLSLDWGRGHSWEFLQEQRPQKLLWEVSDSLGKTGKFQRKIHLNQTFCFWGFYLIWVSSLIPNTILRNPSLLLPFRISSQTWREQNHLCAHRKTSQERKKRGKKKIPFLGNQNSSSRSRDLDQGMGRTSQKKPWNSIQSPALLPLFPSLWQQRESWRGWKGECQRNSRLTNIPWINPWRIPWRIPRV